jgi:hypothetical protein
MVTLDSCISRCRELGIKFCPDSSHLFVESLLFEKLSEDLKKAIWHDHRDELLSLLANEALPELYDWREKIRITPTKEIPPVKSWEGFSTQLLKLRGCLLDELELHFHYKDDPVLKTHPDDWVDEEWANLPSFVVTSWLPSSLPGVSYDVAPGVLPS